MMRILFTSDLHGHYKAYSEFSRLLSMGPYSLGIISGDLMTHLSLNKVDENQTDYRRQIEIMVNELQSVLLKSKKIVLFIMGNDDGIIEGGISWHSKKSLININQKKVSYKGYNFIGYQFTPPFLGGLYEKSEDEQEKDFQVLHEKIDNKTILVTHGPPRNILDGDSYGSDALRKLVDSKPPLLHLFGHIHQSFGREGIFMNGAFPSSRKFVDIDLNTLKHSEIPISL